ncbi:MAG: T9SS type A sorting domain-containing protein, partial [Saprospiraceae bacterium]
NILDSLYWSDTSNFTTESVLPIVATAYDLVTENDTFLIPIQIDSLANTIGFELFLNYDTTAIDFIGFTDTTTLISNLTIQDNNGSIQINWNSTDSTLVNTANIPSDTLLQLQFIHTDSCETLISWQTDTTDFYHINTTVNIDANFTNALVTFLQNEIPQQIPTTTMTTIHPDFYWQTMNCVENYHFQLSLDDQFTQVVTDSLLSDTTIWQPNLQQSTTYYWRVAKEDFVGNLFWSDTLLFTTGLVYATTLTIDSILTYNDTANLALTIDSVFHINGFQFDINYNQNEMNFVGLSDTLFANMQTSTNNGILTISWSDTGFFDIVSDTLLIMNFENIAACETPITWNNQSLNYRENANLLNPTIIDDGSIEFLNTDAPNLLMPFDNQFEVYPIVNFNFQSVACTDRYQVQIASSNDFSTILLDSFVVDTFLNAILLDHNSIYFWRVGRWDSQDDIYWSDTLSFQTETLPVLQLMTQDIVTYNDTMTVTISVEDVVWAKKIEFELAYEDFELLGFSDTLVDLSITNTNDTIRFYWETTGTTLADWLTVVTDTLVQLQFKQNTTCETLLEWTFAEATYKNELIPITVKTNDGNIRWVNDEIAKLAFVPNDTVFMPTSFDLVWETIECAETYWLQISKDSLFGDLAVDEMMLFDTFYTVENLETYQDYYWQVGQEDSEGIFHWSSIWTFQTDRTTDDNHLIFPNPADEFVNIWFENVVPENATIQLFSESGQLIKNYTTTITNKQVQLNVSALSRGVYFIRFVNEELVWTEKIVVY